MGKARPRRRGDASWAFVQETRNARIDREKPEELDAEVRKELEAEVQEESEAEVREAEVREELEAKVREEQEQKYEKNSKQKNKENSKQKFKFPLHEADWRKELEAEVPEALETAVQEWLNRNYCSCSFASDCPYSQKYKLLLQEAIDSQRVPPLPLLPLRYKFFNPDTQRLETLRKCSKLYPDSPKRTWKRSSKVGFY